MNTVYFTLHNHSTGVLTTSSVSDAESINKVDTLITTVCLRRIPSFMLPKELLYFLTGYLSRITSIIILKELSTSTTVLKNVPSITTPAIGDYLALISFIDSSVTPQFLNDFVSRPLSTLQPTNTDLSLVTSISPPSAAATAADMSCAVCLEPLCNGKYSLFCGHVFHFTCVQKLETERCPVCR